MPRFKAIACQGANPYTARTGAENPGFLEMRAASVRCVFSDSGRQIRLGTGGPPGSVPGAPPGPAMIPSRSWRAVTQVLRSCAVAGRSAAADVLHAVLPSECRVCGGPMLGFLPVRVCDACVGRVRTDALASRDVLCSRCGEALGMESARFAGAFGATECTACRVTPPPFAKAVSFGTYDDEMREMLHALKFGGVQRVAEHVLGEWMTTALLKLEGEAAADLLFVPVPMFRERERERGFNQAFLLARAAAKGLGRARPWWRVELQPEALLRVKDTKPLHAQRPDQRRKGLRGAFRTGENASLIGREVVLIDDILTTGATARECAKVLLRGGAKKVWVATVARAQPETLRAVEVSVARWNEAQASDSGKQ